ncbi:MAG: hypothetical protein ABI905_06200, partial [Betaproteobacteria bacterium]
AMAEKEGSGALHAMDYLVYAQLQLANDKDAAAVMQEASQNTVANPNIISSWYSLAATLIVLWLVMNTRLIAADAGSVKVVSQSSNLPVPEKEKI